MFPEGRLFEFIIVGAVALIVVGPKDLPILMRKVGQFIGRMRAMAAEFRASFDELARQSELDELRKEVEALRSASPAQAAANVTGVGGTFDDISAELADTGIQFNPAMAYQPQESAAAAADAEAPSMMTPLPATEATPKPARKRRPPATSASTDPAPRRARRKAKAGEALS